jgi:ATP-dependent Zn protease
MYRIKSQTRTDKRFLIQYPDGKQAIINKMLQGFAGEMYKNNCFEITEMEVKDKSEWLRPDEIEYTIEGFVMTPKELKKAIETLHLIKSALPEAMKDHAYRLHTLLTKEPL